MNNTKEVVGAYEELKGILSTIPDVSWFDDDGFAAHANQVISRIASVCPEISDINSYKIPTEYVQGRSGNIINTPIAKAKLSSLIGRLKGTYSIDESSKNNGTTFIQNQNQTQSLSIVLELQEKIISELSKHSEGSKERNFLEKIKSNLPSVKTGVDILASVLKIGSELGLDTATIHKLLGL